MKVNLVAYFSLLIAKIRNVLPLNHQLYKITPGKVGIRKRCE